MGRGYKIKDRQPWGRAGCTRPPRWTAVQRDIIAGMVSWHEGIWEMDGLGGAGFLERLLFRVAALGAALGAAPGAVPEVACKPKASLRGPLAAKQVPPGSTAGSRSSLASRHMGMEIPLVVNWGREEQEEQEVQD